MTAGPATPQVLRRVYASRHRQGWRLYGVRSHLTRCNNQGAPMLDILLAVLGTGGILLMAGYAALCERI